MRDTRVFILSNDPAFRDSLAELIVSAGLGAEPFRSLERWLEAAPGCRDACLLLDAGRGDLTAPEPLARLTAACSRLPVLVVVDRGDVPLAVRAIKLGAVDVLEKPLRDQNLVERIEEAAARGGAAWR